MSTLAVEQLTGTTFIGGAEDLLGHRMFIGCVQDITIGEQILLPGDINAVEGNIELLYVCLLGQSIVILDGIFMFAILRIYILSLISWSGCFITFSLMSQVVQTHSLCCPRLSHHLLFTAQCSPSTLSSLCQATSIVCLLF